MRPPILPRYSFDYFKFNGRRGYDLGYNERRQIYASLRYLNASLDAPVSAGDQHVETKSEIILPPKSLLEFSTVEVQTGLDKLFE